MTEILCIKRRYLATEMPCMKSEGLNEVRGRCILNHRWVDRAPSALAGSQSRGGAPDQRLQPKSEMQNHLVPKRCITHFFRIMMDKANLSSRYGARPLGIRRGGRVPGPSPQRGPPSATGGHLTSSCQARRRGARARDTDQNERPTSRGINILQWNAEGAYKEKIALTEKLHK